jgi:hypothetical protein
MVMLWLRLCDDSCVNRGEADASHLANGWRASDLIEDRNIVVTIRLLPLRVDGEVCIGLSGD